MIDIYAIAEAVRAERDGGRVVDDLGDAAMARYAPHADTGDFPVQAGVFIGLYGVALDWAAVALKAVRAGHMELAAEYLELIIQGDPRIPKPTVPTDPQAREEYLDRVTGKDTA